MHGCIHVSVCRSLKFEECYVLQHRSRGLQLPSHSSNVLCVYAHTYVCWDRLMGEITGEEKCILDYSNSASPFVSANLKGLFLEHGKYTIEFEVQKKTCIQINI